MPSTTVGDYLIHELLGSGGFGKVYSAMHTPTNRQVAAKRLENPDHRWAKTEIDNLDKLPSHENVVPILHHQRLGNDYWIFMQYADLGDLRDFIRKHGSLSLELQMHIMVDSTRAVEFLHDNRIIHRDLKPANILLVSNPGGGLPVVRVTDFGLSKFLSRGDSSTMHTVVGTREFMPPEMFVEEGQSPSYKGSADIFSLGLVFLTLLQDRGSGNLIPEAEDSQLSARELEYKSLGKAMFMRSNEVPEIKIAVIRDSDPQLVQRVKKLIADMTQIIHQYRPAAEDVLRKLQRLQRIQQG